MMARRRNYKRDGRGRFARVASRAGKSYVRGKSRRVDARKARSAAIRGSATYNRARKTGAAIHKVSTNKKLNRAINVGATAVEIGGPLLGAGALYTTGRAARKNDARRAASAYKAISSRAAKIPSAKVNRKGVYKITNLR
jgi:hypothetical protein